MSEFDFEEYKPGYIRVSAAEGKNAGSLVVGAIDRARFRWLRRSSAFEMISVPSKALPLADFAIKLACLDDLDDPRSRTHRKLTQLLNRNAEPLTVVGGNGHNNLRTIIADGQPPTIVDEILAAATSRYLDEAPGGTMRLRRKAGDLQVQYLRPKFGYAPPEGQRMRDMLDMLGIEITEDSNDADS